MAHDSAPAYFGSHALDHAFCGVGGSVVSTMVMQPLDLVKVRYQVGQAGPSRLPVASTSRTDRSSGRRALSRSKIVNTLQDIVRQDGYKGLYRGLSPNLAGNAASWGLYFLWYTMIKDSMLERASRANPDSKGKGKERLSAASHLAASAGSGLITAIMTNPLWVVKTRMFTTSSPSLNTNRDAAAVTQRPFRNVWDGLVTIARHEGLRGLYRGTALALIGVSNGAIQFVAYEDLKARARDRAQRRSRAQGRDGIRDDEDVELSNLAYIAMSGSSKLLAIAVTYPYQVVRSRIQQYAYIPIGKGPTVSGAYSSIPDCIARTYRQEGLRAFYRGLGTNAVRILPGTCVVFLVYENLSTLLRRKAREREARAQHELELNHARPPVSIQKRRAEWLGKAEPPSGHS
ncbi:uncharacterized protein L969DRAFT_102531 [Mixia osmundae IAM 14324]|uniref:Uncharacterized protein n=1 Tax=Mixia osmundae (strain CBS 9802 / IAM 14324 / JCM 22182 / KY 12970) TaxID=764103 RepID=G7DUH3_MIXOS|nr:uncharacterized protein L969DRAFT_102531 [Mixia osmundae IAM 14324]KEI41106.1 hypothetical protein L969DRAFT_102531 [Mixia osmundae IAM 14324]GAA94233.1 hypothetical protein E5Q_00882 [Mixia osmundae IAM 14324]